MYLKLRMIHSQERIIDLGHNRRGLIQGSILEQDGETLFGLQPEIQALVKEGWKP
jgi:hypothetical protein